jgi:hypothetical protein
MRALPKVASPLLADAKQATRLALRLLIRASRLEGEYSPACRR